MTLTLILVWIAKHWRWLVAGTAVLLAEVLDTLAPGIVMAHSATANSLVGLLVLYRLVVIRGLAAGVHCMRAVVAARTIHVAMTPPIPIQRIACIHSGHVSVAHNALGLINPWSTGACVDAVGHLLHAAVADRAVPIWCSMGQAPIAFRSRTWMAVQACRTLRGVKAMNCL